MAPQAKKKKLTEETGIILTADKMRQTITRMAHEIVEKNRDLNNLVLVGIVTRGGVLARRLTKKLKKITEVELPTGVMDTTLYRDDFNKKGATLKEDKGTDIPFSIEGKTVLLVDDVLFTGRTINAAITHLFDLGRPKEVQLAVLIDRGHRELPIRPDYCGKNVPTQYVEKIRVRFKECDGKDIVLTGAGDENGE
ncbi:Pyrimidine operon regulatory protein PyrR [hydrothermal vent metagenome]|uniref:Pyrimidine operon regulatory protein PyrR n=1 Tax=hydrothermal vent metagenome TaxID=652676 RepID=A0A3B1C376_9ZZZZ